MTFVAIGALRVKGFPVYYGLIQDFEADFLWKASLKILN